MRQSFRVPTSSTLTQDNSASLCSRLSKIANSPGASLKVGSLPVLPFRNQGRRLPPYFVDIDMVLVRAFDSRYEGSGQEKLFPQPV